MSEQYQVVLPKLGESIVSATIVQWFKQEGDLVRLDEPLLEVSTDKVNSEIPSPVSGVLKKIIATVDQEIGVGQVLALIELTTSQTENLSGEIITSTSSETQTQPNSSTEMQDFYSPALLRMAKEHHISLDELSKIPATGTGGRISKKDLELYIEKKGSKKLCPMNSTTPSKDIEHVKMTGMRKAIADNMVRSFYEAPHASLITEVDVTNIVKLIHKEKEAFFSKNGFKLTITSFVAKAIIDALKQYPFLNASVEHDTIVVKRFINIGIAVSVDQGVMVPVIKNAHDLSLIQLAKQMSDLSLKARNSQLEPADVKEGTVTLTNFGISGVMLGIPIIRYPEVAIIGVGAICKKVVVLDDETFGVRSIVHLSLTFDHRVIDGMYGCAFLNQVQSLLQSKEIPF
jgi:2-oxoglutarate dehydrogenase E2 component (dihydrolipoamide succinyltransferase)